MGARHSVVRCPRWWSGAEDRSKRIRQCVSEDRRPGVPTKSRWVGVRISWGGRCRAARWGAWAPKVRQHSESLIYMYLLEDEYGEAVPRPRPRRRPSPVGGKGDARVAPTMASGPSFYKVRVTISRAIPFYRTKRPDVRPTSSPFPGSAALYYPLGGALFSPTGRPDCPPQGFSAAPSQGHPSMINSLSIHGSSLLSNRQFGAANAACTLVL